MKKFSQISLLLVIMLFAFIAPVSATKINDLGSTSKDVVCAALPNVRIDTKIVNTVHIAILAIQIVVPILLIIFGMLDLTRAVIAQKEDEIKKGQQTFIKRLVAAAIVFFVIAVVKLVIGFVSGDKNIVSCVNCFINGSGSATCK